MKVRILSLGIFMLLPIGLLLFQNCAGGSESGSNFDRSQQDAIINQDDINSTSNSSNSATVDSSNYTFPGSASSFFSSGIASSTSSTNSTSSSNTTSTSSSTSQTSTTSNTTSFSFNTASISPGANCSYVKSLSGLGYQQLLNDFAAAFDGSYLMVGEKLNWASGVLTRNSDGSLQYTVPNDSAATLIIRRTDNPGDVALKSFNIHRHWMKQYGVQFGKSQTQLVGAAKGLASLFAYPMDANKSFDLGFIGIYVSTATSPGDYTFHTPDGLMTSVQFTGSTWCLAMTSDWGQAQ